MPKFISNIQVSTRVDVMLYEYQQYRNFLTRQEAVSDLLEQVDLPAVIEKIEGAKK